MVVEEYKGIIETFIANADRHQCQAEHMKYVKVLRGGGSLECVLCECIAAFVLLQHVRSYSQSN